MTTLFGYLWANGYLKQDSIGWNIWIWLVYQRWNQWMLIPYHCVMGVRYGYRWNDIIRFCREVVRR